MNALGERLLPYMVTALFAGIGWAVTHTVERLGKSPILEYDKKLNASDTERSLVLTLRNPSDERLFKNVSLVFLIEGKDGGNFLGARAIPKPPASSGNDEPETYLKSVRFQLPELRPGGEVDLMVRFSGAVAPIVRLEKAEPTARMLSPSLELMLLNHHFKIIVAVLLVWASVLAWLIARRQVGKKRKTVRAAK